MNFISIGFLLTSSLLGLTNNFECDKLDEYDCHTVGYCYVDDNGDCQKDLCLKQANGNVSNTGCAEGCNVATFYDRGFFTNPDECADEDKYLYICTSRSVDSWNSVNDRNISECFAGFVLSNGVCSKDTYGDVGYCANITESFETSSGTDYDGVYCDYDEDYECRSLGTKNCQMGPYCAIQNGGCVADSCVYYGGGTTSCSTSNGCTNYSMYSYSGSGSTYTISSNNIICGKAENKYGDVKTPDACRGLETTYYAEDPATVNACNRWDSTTPLPPSSANCTVSSVVWCGETYCNADCRKNAYSNCTSAAGIAGVKCSVQTYEGYVYCSDGRVYAAADTAFAVRVPSMFSVLLLAAVIAAAFLN